MTELDRAHFVCVRNCEQGIPMVYRGHVINGVVVLDDEAALPEGAAVRVSVVEAPSVLDEQGLTLGQKILRHAGKAADLPEDAAANQDHYLYGTPKK